MATTPASDHVEQSDGTMLDKVQGRLEDLLSKQNLERDIFIQQNINAQMFVPLYALSSHEHIRSLGADISTLIEAARRSDRLAMDEDSLMVRPLLKARRNTIILHDLPEDATEEELRAVFEACPESKSFQSLRPDVNRTAYVTFETEETAQSTALWLRSQKLRGTPLKCSIKAEHFLKSFFPIAAVTQQEQTPPLAPQQQVGMDPFYHQHAHSSQLGHHGAGSAYAVNDFARGVAERLEEASIAQGYAHDFRKYSRQELVELCNLMEDVEQPESFAKLCQNETDAVLFREAACREWAPAPIPRTNFSGGLFNSGNRSRSRSNPDDNGKEATGSAGSAAEPSNSHAWSSSNQPDDDSYQYYNWSNNGYDDDMWSAYSNAGGWDSSSWSQYYGGRDYSWSSRRWSASSSQQPRQRWVEKNSRKAKEVEEAEPGWASASEVPKAEAIAGPTGGAPSALVAGAVEAAAAAAATAKARATAAATTGAAAAAGESGAAPATQGGTTPTWADRVRQGKAATPTNKDRSDSQ